MSEVVDDPVTDSDLLSHRWWGSVLRGHEPFADVKSSITFIDLFSSVGGLSLGFAQAANALGFRSEASAAVDIDQDSLVIYESNFPSVQCVPASVADLSDFQIYGRGTEARLAYFPELIEESLAQFAGKVDVVLAGPPCQGHSTLNNHTRHDDPRNLLYLHAVASAMALQPQTIIIENVPAVRRDKSSVVLTAKAILESAGYMVDDEVLAADQLGAPQTRKRHFLVASLESQPDLKRVAASLSSPPMSLWEAISDIEYCQKSFLDEPPALSKKNVDRIDYLFESNQFNLPNQQRPVCHQEGHTYPSVYGRMSWEKPAQTITTGFMTPGRGRFIHPSARRTLTAHEAARIQGFPDNFSFELPQGQPSKKSLSKWIGDAVPAHLGYVAGISALATINREPGINTLSESESKIAEITSV